jgi:hypothetical protein
LTRIFAEHGAFEFLSYSESLSCPVQLKFPY